MIYYGLCCLFKSEDIKFKTYTKSGLLKLSEKEQKEKVESVINHNINSLQQALTFCKNNNIDSYRFSSDLIPHFDFVKEHNLLPSNFIEKLSSINSYHLKISAHPGQYNNIGSLNKEVVQNSLKDILYHLLINYSITTDKPEINVHLGGISGDKELSKERFIKEVLKNNFEDILTIENDELSYSIEDCLDVHNSTGCRITFDLHHHNCHKLKIDYSPTLSDQEFFRLCKNTWLKKGYNYMRIHISEPKDGYSTPSKSRPHSDYIQNIPEWLLEESKNFDIYIDIEAKFKELAIQHLQNKYKGF